MGGLATQRGRRAGVRPHRPPLPESARRHELRVIAGKMHGLRSPVATLWDTVFADIAKAGTVMPLDPDYEERALFVLSGEIEIWGDSVTAGTAPGAAARRPHRRARSQRCALCRGRRRRNGRAAPHLVEFRLVPQGTHRRRQSRLESRPLRPRAGRHHRIHPAAGPIGNRRHSRFNAAVVIRRACASYLPQILHVQISVAPMSEATSGFSCRPNPAYRCAHAGYDLIPPLTFAPSVNRY